MRLELDREANAAYVRVSDGEVNRTERLDANRLVDRDDAGRIVGIEFLTVQEGVDLTDLPNQGELERLFGTEHIPTFA
jgi:uncharacterized protein YuzE